MVSLIEELFPLQRMIVSTGLDKTFEILKREIPNLVVHEYPTGSIAEDWEVPEGWEVQYGEMRDQSNNIIASTDENILFVAAYSEPIEGWFTKEEIKKHLRTRKDQPNAFGLEHRNAYNYKLIDWGISLPYERWINLSEDQKYYIKIVIKKNKSSMKVGEWFLKGNSDEVICINAHIDELCNDDLSGCVLAIEIMRHIAQIQNRKYSYQMLLFPETIGAIFYIVNNQKIVRKTVGVLNLEAVGAGDKWCLKKALQKESLIEKALKQAILSCNIKHSELEFFEGYGNDERLYAYPTLKIPGVALQRYPFSEYHTSNDCPQIIENQYLEESLKICMYCVSILEKNYIPQYRYIMPPWLTKHDLYIEPNVDYEKYNKLVNKLMYSIDGKIDLLKLSEITELEFFEVYDYLEKFVEQGFIFKSKENNEIV